MAKRKADEAPVNSQVVGVASALDRFMTDLDANIKDVREKCARAFDENMSRGFPTQLAAAEAIDANLDVLAAWSPKDARVIDDPAENLIRDAHTKSEPQSSWLALKQAKDMLALLSNACEPSVVDPIRAKKKILPKRAETTPAEGRAALQAARDDAAKAKDADRVATLDRHIKAIGKPDLVAELVKDATLVEKANSRWRARLYIPRITQYLAPAGKVPTSDYERVCAVAASAHKGMNKVPAQDRTAKLVKATIDTALTDWVAVEYGTKEKDKRTNDELGKAAVLAVFRNAREATKHGAIPESVRDVIIAYMTGSVEQGGAGVADPAIKVSKKKVPAAPVSKKAQAKKAAPLPSATPRKPRAKKVAPPPSTVVATAAGNVEELMEDFT